MQIGNKTLAREYYLLLHFCAMVANVTEVATNPTASKAYFLDIM